MVYSIGILADISDAIRQALRTLMGHFAALIYNIIEYLYDIFIYISRAEILENEFVKNIYQRVGILLGIFMIFKLTFSLIQSLIEPEKFTDKKNGYAAIIQRSVISIVLLGITPSIFREAFKIQNLIIGTNNNDNIIYKLIANKNYGDIDDMGRKLASDLYFSFYTDEESPYYSNGVDDTIVDSDSEQYVDRFVAENYDNIVIQVNDKRMSFDDTVEYLSLKQYNKYLIEFNEILSIGLGLLVAWMLITYCIQAAVRVIQLAYLQLIAPIPILSYISDPDGAFKKWINQCTTTFLDLFFRLAIIYFVMTVVGNILDQFSSKTGTIFLSTGLPTDDWFLLTLVKIFIILGLMMFAKKVPDLLKDLFPNMGGGVASLGFGLKSPKSMANDMLFGDKIYGYSKKAAGWGWKHTGALGVSKIKKHHEIRKTDKQNRKDIEREEDVANKTWNKYGQAYDDGDFEKVFGNKEYATSYSSLKNAKDNAKAANNEFNAAQNALNEAVASNDKDAIKIAQARAKAAYENQQQAERDLKAAQTRHDNNRKKYGDLARREDALKRYENMHKFVQRNPQPTPPTPAPSPAPAQPQRSPLPNGNTVTPSGIEVVESNRPQQPSRTERERQANNPQPQDEHSRLVERYNNATDPAERDNIRRQIEDFERRH